MNRLIYRGGINCMTDIMVDEFGITKEEFIQLHKKLLGTISPDELMENMRTIKSRYRLSASAMASLVYERLDLVASRDSLNKLMQIQARYGIKDEQIASLLGSWRVKFLTQNIEYLTNIEKEVGPELILGFLTIEQLAYIILSIGILSFICSLIYIFNPSRWVSVYSIKKIFCIKFRNRIVFWIHD